MKLVWFDCDDLGFTGIGCISGWVMNGLHVRDHIVVSWKTVSFLKPYSNWLNTDWLQCQKTNHSQNIVIALCQWYFIIKLPFLLFTFHFAGSYAHKPHLLKSPLQFVMVWQTRCQPDAWPSPKMATSMFYDLTELFGLIHVWPLWGMLKSSV